MLHNQFRMARWIPCPVVVECAFAFGFHSRQLVVDLEEAIGEFHQFLPEFHFLIFQNRYHRTVLHLPVGYYTNNTFNCAG